MAATGNEAVRLAQLKGVYPQIVSLNRNASTPITLGNGKTITFSCKNGGNTKNIHLLVKAMYNSFELLQAVSDGANRSIEIVSDAPMKTFEMKMQGGGGKIYYISNNRLNAFDVSAGNSFGFIISENAFAFVGATIYVE